MLIASLISLDGGQYTALAMAGLACQLTSSRHATAHHGAYSLTIPYLSLSLSPQVGRLATDVLAALPETAQLITRPAKLLELSQLQALRDGGLLDLNTGLDFSRSLVRPLHAACYLEIEIEIEMEIEVEIEVEIEALLDLWSVLCMQLAILRLRLRLRLRSRLRSRRLHAACHQNLLECHSSAYVDLL
jgi:hypothetical protein